MSFLQLAHFESEKSKCFIIYLSTLTQIENSSIKYYLVYNKLLANLLENYSKVLQWISSFLFIYLFILCMEPFRYRKLNIFYHFSLGSPHFLALTIIVIVIIIDIVVILHVTIS